MILLDANMKRTLRQWRERNLFVILLFSLDLMDTFQDLTTS